MEVVGSMFGIVRFVIWVQTWVISGWGCGGGMGGGGPVDLADYCWILEEVHLDDVTVMSMCRYRTL